MTRARAALALALSLPACSYDLSVLRRPDASADRPRPLDQGVPVDLGPPVDVATDLGPTVDAGAVDAGDAGLRAGTCDLDGGAVVQLSPPIAAARPGSDAGARLAYALVSGDLRNAPAVRLPTGILDGGAILRGCNSVDSNPTPPTRIYRYTVAEGGVVTATTNTQHCTAFDTRVYALWGCKAQELASPAACGDDLMDGTDTARCATCGMGGLDAGGTCSSLLSTIETPPAVPLRRGEVVFFAVTGYNIQPGAFPHRLWVGENAARVENFPAAPRVPAVNRCVCQEGTASATTRFFPYPVALENFPTTVSAGGASTSFLGVRDFATGSYSGVSLQLRVARWNLSSAAGCARESVRAVFDLIVGGAMVTSFSIPGTLAPPVTVTVPYTGFAPQTLTRGAMGMPIELRLREVQPQSSCLTLDLDPAPGASAITLYGG